MKAGFLPTHRVAATGAKAWAAPDVNAAADAPLDAGLEVMIVESHGAGWARVRCHNDWETWVAAQALELLGPSSPNFLVPPAALAPRASGVAPGKKSRKALVVALLLVLVAGAAAIVWFFKLRTYASDDRARVFSVAMIALMIGGFALSLRGITRPGRTRPFVDLGRALLSIAAVIAVGAATHAAAARPALALALAVGFCLGAVEGARLRVVMGPDRRRYSRPPILPLVAGFAGLLLAVVGATADQRPLVGVGQLIAAGGAGLLLGTAIARSVANRGRPAVRVSAVLLFGVGLLLPMTATFFDDADAGAAGRTAAQASLEGTYKGTLNFPTPPAGVTSTATINEVDLKLTGDSLTGTVRRAQKDNYSAGSAHVCAYTRATLTGSELRATHRADGSISMAGAITAETNLDIDTFSPCTVFPTGSYSHPSLPVTLEINASGLRGSVGDAGATIDAKRIAPAGGSGEPAPKTSPPGTAEKPPSGTALGPSGTSRSPSGTGSVISPSSYRRGEDPIDPVDATDGAILVVLLLAGSGAISVAQAQAARNALIAGAVPEDVLEQLARKRRSGAGGAPGGFETLPEPTGGLPPETSPARPTGGDAPLEGAVGAPPSKPSAGSTRAGRPQWPIGNGPGQLPSISKLLKLTPEDAELVNWFGSGFKVLPADLDPPIAPPPPKPPAPPISPPADEPPAENVGEIPPSKKPPVKPPKLPITIPGPVPPVPPASPQAPPAVAPPAAPTGQSPPKIATPAPTTVPEPSKSTGDPATPASAPKAPSSEWSPEQKKIAVLAAVGLSPLLAGVTVATVVAVGLTEALAYFFWTHGAPARLEPAQSAMVQDMKEMAAAELNAATQQHQRAINSGLSSLDPADRGVFQDPNQIKDGGVKGAIAESQRQQQVLEQEAGIGRDPNQVTGRGLKAAAEEANRRQGIIEREQ